MNAPAAPSLLIIGDSWSNNPSLTPGVYPDQMDLLEGVTLANLAVSGNCLLDETGTNGTVTILNTIATYLAAAPNADLVLWATSAANDILRRAQGANAVTGATLLAAATTVCNAIAAADKRAIIMLAPYVSVMGTGFGGNTEVNATAANVARLEYNAGLYTLAASLGFQVWDPKWLYNFTDVNDFTQANGLVTAYNEDGLHPNFQGACLLAQNALGMVRANPFRKAA